MIKNNDTLWIVTFIIFALYTFKNESILLTIFFLLILAFIIYNHSDKINYIIKDIKNPVKIDNNYHYNDNIKENLKKIEKYKKYNLNEYHTGLKYYHKFMDNIHILENRNLEHSIQYLDNAKYFLKKSINHFQYITTSITDKNLIDGLKYGDYTSTKKVKKLHKIIDDLYKISFNILFTISNDKENIFLKNPDIYKGHINIIEPESIDEYDKYNLY